MGKSSNSEKSTNQKESEQLAGALAEDGSLDTVRDILFGKQFRQTQSKERELEKLIKSSIGELDKKIQARFKDMDKTISTLRKDLDKAAAKTAKAVASEFDATRERIADLDASTRKAQSDMFDDLETARLLLEKEAKAWNESLGKELDDVHAALRHEKTDRVALAKLLSGMARELAGDEGAS